MRAASFLVIILTWLFAVVQPAEAGTEFPFVYRDGMIWLKVSVAGKGEPLNFLLDSGAGRSVLDLYAARHLGLKLGKRQPVLGVSSRNFAYRVEGFAAQVAGVSVASSILAVDLSGPSRGCSQRIDGLIGADFFQQHIVRIDYAARTIRLLQRDEMNVAEGESLPLARRNDTLSAQVSVDGNAPEWLRLDTGCSTTLEWVVNGDKAKKLGLTTIGLNSSSVREIHTDVQFGTKRIAAVKTGVHSEQMFAGEAGLIGNGLLSRFTVTIDAARRRCLLAGR